MQKQQHNPEAVLLQERLEEHKNINVTRYKVIDDVVFMDGFVLVAGSEVRGVVDSKNKSDYINVVYEDEYDVKRMMWIKNSNLNLLSSNNERWEFEDYKNEIKDKDENWFA